MTKRIEPEPKTEEYDRYECEYCSGDSSHSEITWLHYDPVLICETNKKWITKSGSKERYDSYQNAISISSKWVVGLCGNCLGVELVDEPSVTDQSNTHQSPSKNTPDVSGPIVNDKIKDYESITSSEEKYYCDLCGSECTNHHSLHEDPDFKLNRSKTKPYASKCYVSKNWFDSKSPDWSDVTQLQTSHEYHFCNNCFSQLRASRITEIRVGFKRLLTRFF